MFGGMIFFVPRPHTPARSLPQAVKRAPSTLKIPAHSLYNRKCESLPRRGAHIDKRTTPIGGPPEPGRRSVSFIANYNLEHLEDAFCIRPRSRPEQPNPIPVGPSLLTGRRAAQFISRIKHEEKRSSVQNHQCGSTGHREAGQAQTPEAGSEHGKGNAYVLPHRRSSHLSYVPCVFPDCR
jgi:hypothetical protein